MAVKPIPDRYHSVTPYLVVDGAAKVIEFLKKAFGATDAEVCMQLPDGKIKHAEIQVGDSIIMLADATSEHKASPAMFYLYVEDTDAQYKRALESGATSVMEPTDQFYGDRNAGVKDPSGNQWWIATHIEDVSDDEMKRRAEAMMKARVHA